MYKDIKMDDFKDMFSAFCNNEVEANNCEEGECQWCCINEAWKRIFHNDRFDEYYDDEDYE